MKPSVKRDGDVWTLQWNDQGVQMVFESPLETKVGLRFLVTVEGDQDGRVVGPVGINVLDSRSQTEISNACQRRVNGHGPDMWHALITSACATVAKEYRAPTPTIDLGTVEDSGPVDYLIPGLLPVGETTVIYGDGESSKSLLALRISMAVATGGELPWGPKMPCQEVLYLDWETNARTVASRLRRLALGELIGIPHVNYRQCLRSLADELPSVREEVSRRKIGLVVVDSIGFACTGSLTEDETARAAMNSLRAMWPATRLVVAHVSKDAANQERGKVKPFGSAFFWNGMRSGIEVRRSDEATEDDTMEIGLFHRKANDGHHEKPIGLRVLFDGPAGAIAFVHGDIHDSPDLAARVSLPLRLRAALRGGSKTIPELAEQLDAPAASVARALQRMESVVKLGSGGGGRGNAAYWGLAA